MKKLEEMKWEVRTYFNARIVEIDNTIQVWRAENGSLSAFVLCASVSSDEVKVEELAKWLHNAVDDNVRSGFNALLPLFKGKKWHLKLGDHTATLKYAFAEDDSMKDVLKGEIVFPMTPEIALELVDFACANADTPTVMETYFPNLVKWM